MLLCAKNVLTCQRAFRVLRAYVPHVSKCLASLRTHVSMCFASSCAQNPTCLKSLASYDLRHHVITCQLAFLAY